MRGLPWHDAAWNEWQALRARGVHAVLLHGAAGIGKKGLALDFADALLCESPRGDGHACGECASCRLLAAGNHPDLRLLVPDALASLMGVERPEDADAAVESAPDETREEKGKASREIRIEQVRELADFLMVSTHRAGWRAVVLAPAEALNAASANALLKMLEEPPPSTLFILVTDHLDDVLPTIRSRCLLVRCRAPREDEALAWLRTQGLADERRRLAAAGGAPLSALPAAHGEALDDDLTDLLTGLLAKGPALASAEIAARIPRALPVAQAIALFQRWGWDLLAHKSAQRLRYYPDAVGVFARLAPRTSAIATLAWLDSLLAMRASAEHPLNPRLVVEAALLRYAGLFQTADPAIETTR